MAWRDAADRDIDVGTVHVRTVPLDRHGGVAADHALLDAEEQARARRFAFDRDRHRFVIGRAEMRRTLSHYLDLSPERVPIVAGTFGKPMLGPPAAASGLSFNASGSHDRALIAVTRGRAIGVDIERTRGMPDLADLADTVLSGGERAAFDALDEAARHALFFAAWTRKEAYVKALGEGLARPLTRLQCRILTGRAPDRIDDEDDPRSTGRWTIHAWQPEAGYQAALAVEGEIDAVVFC